MDMEGKREGVSNAIIKGRGGRPQRKWKEERERDGQRQIAIPASVLARPALKDIRDSGRKEGRKALNSTTAANRG